MTFVFGIFALFLSVTGGKDKLRVHQGEEDILHEFPYVVSVEGVINSIMRRFCTGSLITETWVLSAKHCFENLFYFTNVCVRYADFTLEPNETKAYSNLIEVYTYQTMYSVGSIPSHDIALVFIEKVPNGTPIGKLSAVDYKALLGLPVKYAGFGLTTWEFKTRDRNESGRLLMGEGVVVQCEEYPAYVALCMAPKCAKRRQQPRPGDSGGPLVHDGKIIGIARAVDPNGINAASYTPVSSFIYWIKKTTSNTN